MAKISKAVAKVVESGIVYGGKQIILPDDPTKMGYKAAAEALMEKEREESQVVNAHEIIEGNPFDALAAFHETLKQEFGWSTVHPTPSFFGPRPPVMVDVKTGPEAGDVLQVPIGVIRVPNIDNFEFNVHFDHDGLHLFAECKKYQAPILKDLAAKVRVYLRSHSIYRGKAFRMPSAWSDQPEFLKFGHMHEAELVLSKPVQASVRVNLLTPIEKTAAVKADGIPIKRTVVLAGKYGTGKSMTAAITAKVAQANGWTVIYLDDTNRLADALENAKRWQPCVVIAEDIDRVTENRTDKANVIFNTLSGVLGSANEVMVVLTTNHPEKIDRAMLRPGRIDALIEVLAPDAEAVEKLICLYGRGLVKADSLEKVGQMLAGQIPATIREVVERSKLARIANEVAFIDELSLIDAVHSMGPQIELLNTAKIEKMPSLDLALRNTVQDLIDASSVSGAVEAFCQFLEVGGNPSKAEALRKHHEKKKAEAVH
jgi:transitional endoplasmic reticulum ATPase